MDMDLKRGLVKKLDDVAPEYGLVELSYPSFMRCYGYHSQPLSAADAVESVNALLDFAGGSRLEIELEGHRNGGEWFGGGKQWEASGYEKDVLPVIKPNGAGTNAANRDQGEGDENTDEKGGVDSWKKNFWSAYDALTEYVTTLTDYHFEPRRLFDLVLQHQVTPRSHSTCNGSSQSHHSPRNIDYRQAGHSDNAESSCRGFDARA